MKSKLLKLSLLSLISMSGVVNSAPPAGTNQYLEADISGSSCGYVLSASSGKYLTLDKDGNYELIATINYGYPYTNMNADVFYCIKPKIVNFNGKSGYVLIKNISAYFFGCVSNNEVIEFKLDNVVSLAQSNAPYVGATDINDIASDSKTGVYGIINRCIMTDSTDNIFHASAGNKYTSEGINILIGSP